MQILRCWLEDGTRFCTECGTPTGLMPEQQKSVVNQSRAAKEVIMASNPEGYKEKVSTFL